MSELYVVEQGTWLRRGQGRFLLGKQDSSNIDIPIREVERIVVFGNIQLSNAVIGTCLYRQIPIVFLSQLGKYKGHLWSAEVQDLEAERCQFLEYSNVERQLSIAKALIQGKLANSRQLLLRLNRKRRLQAVDQAIAIVQRAIRAVNQAQSLEQLRGYEGVAAARYFPALGQLLINPEFEFSQRNRRPPRDPVNSLLSFGYSLLLNQVISLILVEGLNPYLGNLHRSTKKLPELALDLMEEFRSPIVDTLVVTLVNRRDFGLEDFSPANEEGGVYLTEKSRRLFIQKFATTLEKTVKHPDLETVVSYRRAIHLQVKRYKRMLLHGTPYEAFLRAV